MCIYILYSYTLSNWDKLLLIFYLQPYSAEVPAYATAKILARYSIAIV